MARVNGAFGEGVGPIFLNQLSCDESNLGILECDRQSFLGVVDCSHARDAGVICPGMTLASYLRVKIYTV